jgi:hypothetical protein
MDVKSLRRLIDDQAVDRRGRGIFSLLYSRASASHGLLMSIWATAIAILCLRIARLDRGILLAGSVYYFLVALLSLAATAAVLARLPLPVPTSVRPGRPLKFSLAMLIGLSVGTIFDGAIIIALLRNASLWQASVTEIRIGGLLAFEVLGTLFISKRTTQFSDSRRILSDIRRDLVMGSTPTPEVFYRARVAMGGMLLSDVFSKDVSRLLAIVSLVRSEYDDAFAKIQNLKDNVDVLATREGLTVSAIDKLALGNTLDALQSNELRIMGFIDQYWNLLKSLDTRLTFAAALHAAAQTERQQVMAEIKIARLAADQMQERYLQEYFVLQDIWNGWFPSEQRSHLPFRLTRRKPDAVSANG